MASLNASKVLASLAADLANVPGVRTVTTRSFTPADVPGMQTPIIGLYEESIAESHGISKQRKCVMSVRLDCIVQGETESRAREIRDAMRLAINLHLQQDTSRGGWAVYTEDTSQWILSTHEDPTVLQLEKLIKVAWDERADER